MQKKILIAIIINIIVISVTLGIISYVTLHESINQALQIRLALARIIAKYVDISLNQSLNKLYEVSYSDNTGMGGGEWRQKQKMLENIYKHSIFSEGVFLLDKHGNTLITYPNRIEHYLNLTHITSVNQVLREGVPVISNVFTIEPIQKKVIFVLTPLKDSSGKVTGIVGGIIGPSSELFNELLMSAKKEWEGFAEIIDANETIVASSNPALVFQSHNHDFVISKMIKEGRSGIIECRHSSNYSDSQNYQVHILTVVPIHITSWAVIIAQPEEKIFSPAAHLQMDFLLVVFAFVVISTLISINMSKKIVSPLKSLISSANRLASGDLSTPVGNLGSDEILKLSQSFDEMRQKLKESYENIKMYNLELENRVVLRTEEIEESRQRIKHLLIKVIKSEEDERKRVARDLHDTILQDISAFLIQLEICKLHPETISMDKINEMRDVAVKTIDNIHTIVKNLRPTMLDDLGLEAAINVLATSHLTRRGIFCYFDIKSSITGKLSPDVEISVFRIVQEAIRNIGRHSKAENVFIAIEIDDSYLKVIIEDDGIGFNIQELMHLPAENGRGLGIIGMKERASLIGGELLIHSEPGEGTKLSIQIPLTEES